MVGTSGKRLYAFQLSVLDVIRSPVCIPLRSIFLRTLLAVHLTDFPLHMSSYMTPPDDYLYPSSETHVYMVGPFLVLGCAQRFLLHVLFPSPSFFLAVRSATLLFCPIMAAPLDALPKLLASVVSSVSPPLKPSSYRRRAVLFCGKAYSSDIFSQRVSRFSKEWEVQLRSPPQFFQFFFSPLFLCVRVLAFFRSIQIFCWNPTPFSFVDLDIGVGPVLSSLFLFSLFSGSVFSYFFRCEQCPSN